MDVQSKKVVIKGLVKHTSLQFCHAERGEVKLRSEASAQTSNFAAS